MVHLPNGVKDLNDLGRLPDCRATFFKLLKSAEATEDHDAAETS
jgi:hypothetical protein